MGKTNSRGRAKGRFAMVTESMMDSPAWLDLSGIASKLLLRLILLSKGNNGFGDGAKDRGRLFMSEREAARLIGCAKNTAAKALTDLESHGFIQQMSEGRFGVKLLASTWRLTFQPYPHGSLGPTNEWQRWEPAENKTQAQKLTTSGSKTDHFPDALDEIDSRIEPVGVVSPNLSGSKTGPHIEYTTEGVESPAARPVKRRGNFVASPAAKSPDPIRSQVAERWQLLDATGRKRLAKAVNISPRELREYVEGGATLSIQKETALRTASRSMAA